MSLPESDPLPKSKSDIRPDTPTGLTFIEQFMHMTPDRPSASNRHMNDPMRPTPHHLLSPSEYEAEMLTVLHQIRLFAESDRRIDSGRPVGAIDVLITALAAMQQYKITRFDYDQYMSLKREMDLMAITTRELLKESDPGEHDQLKTMSAVFNHYVGKYRELRDRAVDNRNKSWWKRIAGAALGSL